MFLAIYISNVHFSRRIELNQEHFGAMIFYDLRCGLNKNQCADQLASICDVEAPSCATVFRYFSEHNRGYTSFQDEFHEGRPRL